MNRVILSGGLTRDPEIRYTQTGKAVATLSLAVARGWKKAENSNYPPSDYFTVVAWDKTAEFCNKYLTKGSRILVEGRLQSRTYDAQDGSKRYITEVVASELEFIGAKRQTNNDYNNGYNGYNNNEEDPAAFLNEVRSHKNYDTSPNKNDGNGGAADVPF